MMMYHFGLDGGQKIIMEILHLKNYQIWIWEHAQDPEKMIIAGKKFQVDLFLIMMFIWNLMIDGPIKEI